MRLNTTAQDLEAITYTTAEKDPAVEEALQIYMSLPKDYLLARHKFDSLRAPALKPLQVDQLLSRILAEDKAMRECEGQYITYHVQRSYDVGYGNNFTLHFNDVIPQLFGEKLKGTPLYPIKIRIIGNLGYFGFVQSENICLMLDGDAEDCCCAHVGNCEITVTGSVGRCFGQNALNSRFNIYGEAGIRLGYGAHKCKFRTRTQEFYATRNLTPEFPL